MNKIIWNRNEVNINKTFSYNIAMNVTSDNEYQETMTIKDYQQINDWTK